ncbi:MAG TPA: hypothetical protein VK858_14935 [Longimicrobiales bacterium]|nr:hypothetical protein [Longimicrobiales bacterium]
MTDIPVRLDAVVGGRYRVERKLRGGGVASVYLARSRRWRTR